MLSIFPPPNYNNGINYTWDQLVLGINNPNSHRDIVDDFWEIIIPVLSGSRNVDISDPNDKAWFHLRRRLDTNNISLQYGLGRIEILRLKRGFLTQETQENIRLLPSKYRGIISAGWWPVYFEERNDNAFLSFLQKLSVLRGREKIIYHEFLGAISNDYDKCPHCQKAYRIMMTPNNPWTDALTPWFDYMSLINLEPNKTHEYAHWFGHILSGWP